MVEISVPRRKPNGSGPSLPSSSLLGLTVTLRHCECTVESEPKNAQARYQLGCALAGQGQYAEALKLLLAAAEIDPKLAAAKVREAMVKVFQIVGLHSELANDYRDKLSTLLF